MSKETPWQPGEKQDAPTEKEKPAKKAKKKAPAKSSSDTNADGNTPGQRATFEQIQAGMKKQSQPLIERSNRRRR